MRHLARLIRALVALLLAIPCGALVLVLAILFDPVASEALTRLGLAGFMQGMTDLASGIGPETILVLAHGLARAGFVLLVLPPAAMAVVGEALSLRSRLAYACGTGAVTAFVPWAMRGGWPTAHGAQALAAEGRITALLFLAGAASGLVYGALVVRDRTAP